MNNQRTKRMVESAMLIALATILSRLKLFEFPFGGSITVVSMLPMLILSYRYGVKWGLLASTVYAFLRGLIGAATGGLRGLSLGTVFAVLLLDYLLAYICLGFGGIFRTKINNIVVGFCLSGLIAGLLRYMCSVLSGFLFYGEYAEWFFLEAGFPNGEKICGMFTGKMLSFVYSLTYNGAYMLPEIALTLIVGGCIAKVFGKTLFDPKYLPGTVAVQTGTQV